MSNPYKIWWKCHCGNRLTPKERADLHICEKCGREVAMTVKTIERWVNTPIWYKPWTWLSGYYEQENNK